MALKDLAALYGRVALVVVAFAFVAGIVAGPMLQRFLGPQPVAAIQGRDPAPSLIRGHIAPDEGKPG